MLLDIKLVYILIIKHVINLIKCSILEALRFVCCVQKIFKVIG